MSTSDNGGPAYPVIELNHDGSPYHQSLGISVRDYFIAHAPAEPQPWFYPNVPPCPEIKGWANSNNPGRVYACEAHAMIDNTRGEVTPSNQKEIEQWHKEYTRQRYIQWPAAWADEQLKAREE